MAWPIKRIIIWILVFAIGIAMPILIVFFFLILLGKSILGKIFGGESGE